MDNLAVLQGMDLASLAWDNKSFEMKAIGRSGEMFQAFLSNHDQAPIAVQVHWAKFQLVADGDQLTLGEIETVTLTNGVLHIEMDSGFFSVTANKHFLQRL